MDEQNNPSAESESESFPLFDAIDNEILMHRDAHFGGNFDFMINYYKKGGRGARDDFNLERILYLAETEKQLHQNLAAVLLTGADAEKIARSKEMYKQLRDLYEIENQTQAYPQLIANMILAEDEDVEPALEAIIKEKGAILRSLIELLRTEDLYDPLFPGYGLAPSLAVRCLAKIGDKRSIITLFESLGQSDFFADEQVIEALYAIGNESKNFLLKVVQGTPYNEDNEKAAMALIRFKDDPEVAETCLKVLKSPEARKDIPLSTYLILICEGLKDPAKQKELMELGKDPKTPKMLLMDINTVANTWK